MGAYTYELEIDNDAVKKLASDLDLMDSAKFQNSAYAIKRQQEKYFSDFNSARTINQFLSFINTYKDSDPSNLIPRAEAQIRIIKERDRLLSEKLKEEQDFIKNSALTTKNLEGSLGKRICLDTTLTYSYDTGSSNYSEGRIFETIREPGTIYAAIDSYEIKNRKIKIVVSGHKTPNGKLKRNPASEIRSYDIVATPGAQLWTDIDGWRFCR